MNLKKIMIVALLILLAVFSVTKVAPWAMDPENHTHSIEQTENKIATVMTLSGGAAATAATLSLLPGDMCTPIAEQLAELAKYFLLILSALYLEKFLIVISGFITFAFFIPASLVIQCGRVLFNKKNWSMLAAKVAFLGIVLFLIVPASVRLSDMVYQTQAEKVNAAVEEYNSLDIEGEAEDGLFDKITSIASDTMDKVTKFLSSLLESLAVMLVTSCIIPILVFVFLVWLVKTVFASNVLTFDASAIESLKDIIKKEK
jgi:hypothetical protein